jgi:uncharacterized membrane protein YdfJ with MMPL/SSD domain
MGVASLMPTQMSGGHALITAIPRQDPSNPAVGRTIDRLRAELPSGSRIGGAVAENHDLQGALSAKTPLVIGVVMGLGFLLLLIALQALLIAAAGVLTNLLAAGAACGVATWIFQDGALHSLLGFQSQGFLDAWTFALSGPLPPKEMGIIRGVAVLLDAALIRLLLLPVLLRLMGKWAWYLPPWAHRVLPDVKFGHARSARNRPGQRQPSNAGPGSRRPPGGRGDSHLPWVAA